MVEKYSFQTVPFKVWVLCHCPEVQLNQFKIVNVLQGRNKEHTEALLHMISHKISLFVHVIINPCPHEACGWVKVVGLFVCVCACVLVSMWSHFGQCFLQWWMSLGSQIWVIAANRGLLSFHFTFDCLWSLNIFLKSGKSDLRISKAIVKPFESTFGWLERKYVTSHNYFIAHFNRITP